MTLLFLNNYKLSENNFDLDNTLHQPYELEAF